MEHQGFDDQCFCYFSFALLCKVSGVTSEIVLNVAIILMLVPVFLTAIFNPHKFLFYNIVDIFLLLIFVSSVTSITAVTISTSMAVHSAAISNVLVCIFSSIPLLYLIAVLLYKLLAHKRFVQKACQKVCTRILYHFRETDQIDFERALPHRLVHANEYTPLLCTDSTEHTVAEQDNGPVSRTY